MRKTLLLFISPLLLIGSELIVDNKAFSQYQIDNYAFFDEFDYHGGFDGYEPKWTSDRIFLPETFPILGNAFTLEAWFYARDGEGNITIIGTESIGDGSDIDEPPMIILHKSNSIKYGFGTGSDEIISNVNNVRSPDTWHHVAYTFDGTDSKLYVDGIMVDSSRVAEGKTPVQKPLDVIGKKMRGKIDEVRVWSLARTQQEIESSMDDILNAMRLV